MINPTDDRDFVAPLRPVTCQSCSFRAHDAFLAGPLVAVQKVPLRLIMVG
jgi:hypothetical protein